MNEQDPYMLGHRTIPEWHAYLNTDRESGADTGHLACPGSRYGGTSEQVAWFALGLSVVFAEVNSVDDDFENTVDECMSLSVNDHADAATLIVDNWYVLPRVIKEQIGRKKEVRRLI